MKVPAGASGKKFRCVKCGTALLVGPENTRPLATSPQPAHDTPPKTTPPGGTVSGATTNEHATTDDLPLARPDLVGKLLLEEGLITQAQLSQALAHQRTHGGKKTFEILIELGYLTKEQLHTFLSKQPGVAAIDLARYNLDRQLLNLIPKELAQTQLVLPVDKLGKLLTVAMACPLDHDTISAISEKTGLRVRAMLARLDDIRAAVEKYYREPAPPISTMSPPTAPTPPTTAPGPTAPPPPPPAVPKANVENILSQTSWIPIREETRTALAALEGQNTRSLAPFSELCLRDGALTADLLRQANAEMYRTPGQVQTFAMALALIGIDDTLNLVKQLPSAEKDTRFLFERAAQCAAVARRLMKWRPIPQAGQVLTAALLVEIGRFFLYVTDPSRYAQISPSAFGDALAEQEQQHFTLNYRQAGAAWLTAANIPANIVETIRICATVDAPTHSEVTRWVTLAYLSAVVPEPQKTLPTLPLFKNLCAAVSVEPAELWNVLGR